MFLAVEMKSLILGEAASLRIWRRSVQRLRMAIASALSILRPCTWVLRRFWWRLRSVFMMLILAALWLMRLMRLRFVFARLSPAARIIYLEPDILRADAQILVPGAAPVLAPLVGVSYRADTAGEAYPLKHTNV